jgi:hypothetical protein
MSKATRTGTQVAERVHMQLTGADWVSPIFMYTSLRKGFFAYIGTHEWMHMNEARKKKRLEAWIRVFAAVEELLPQEEGTVEEMRQLFGEF